MLASEINKTLLKCLILLMGMFSCTSPQTEEAAAEQLALDLWNEPLRGQLLNYVATAVQEIPQSERLAVFDFDGTIGCEKPTYMEVFTAANQLCKLAKQDTALLKDELYKAACNGNFDYIDQGETVYRAILTAFLGDEQQAYIDSVEHFTTTAKHPKFKLTYNQLYYAPMLQLINYLKANAFLVYVVSGSEEGFLRAYCENYLDLESEKIIGSTISLDYQLIAEQSSFKRDSAYLLPMADGKGKAELIRNRIGKAPVFAFGNTMGDFEMLTYATTNAYPNLGLILVHDDPQEYVYYDTTLQKEAKSNGWIQVSMKDDFKELFPYSSN